MVLRCWFLLLVTGLPVRGDGSEGLNLLFMADIGHSREHADRLTRPWPMNKCAYEGAFSLYEGLQDFVQNRGAKPTAAIVVGDIAYGGGDAATCNDTRDAFQKYLKGQVSVDRVFPIIGNHDVHFLGCSKGELLTPFSPCYYGTKEYFRSAQYEMSFEQWRQNWFGAFPGLHTQATLPASAEEQADEWIAPFRYNLNLDKASSVYIIAGLITGVYRTSWNNDTPASGLDAAAPGGAAVECRFLRDSLAEGRRLGKTVFVYMTHNFARTCNDWTLLQQLDVWITGHKHSYWQSEQPGSTTAKELRYFPLRILIGNGGFDEGESDTVSFGHLREAPYKDAGGHERVKIHFDVYDTCVSAYQSCPQLGLGGPYCFDRCQSMPGGVDGGGGPRKATPGKNGIGFVFDAPRRASEARELKLFGSPWLLRLGEAGWLSLGTCEYLEEGLGGGSCLVPTSSRELASPIYLAGQGELPSEDANFTAALVLEDQAPAVPMDEGWPLVPGLGYWDHTFQHHGKMNLTEAPKFRFVEKAWGWQMHGLAVGLMQAEYLKYDSSSVLNVTLESPTAARIFV